MSVFTCHLCQFSTEHSSSVRPLLKFIFPIVSTVIALSIIVIFVNFTPSVTEKD
uniref:Dolichol phosphate-mannose biosynthesis regulatory protein n=1 Tax=Ascaris lumbricoides TaxID=6252 RepID=A0A0M3HZM2_ASCLU